MLQALLAILINALVCTGVGIGPLAMLAPSAGPLAVLALAPTAGYALVSMGLTCWLLREGTVASAMLPLTGALLAVSLACLLFGRTGIGRWFAGFNRRRALLGLAGLALCLGLVTGPLAAGNTSYAVFRGNASDSFIYMFLGRYFDEHPRAWAFTHSTKEVEAVDPILGPAHAMLNIRWTSGAMLAYGARLAGVGIVDFQYPFTLLSLVLLYAAALPFLSAMGLSPLYCVLTALALATGFFGQFVLDIRAFSHITVMPLVALLVWAVSLPPPPDRVRSLCRAGLLGLAFLACFINYTEIFPMLAGAAAVFLLLKASVGRLSKREAVVHAAGFACCLAAAWPVRFLFGHIAAQVHFTEIVPRLWSEAYFRWLFDNVPAGIFGLTLATDAFSVPSFLSFLNLPPVLTTAFGCAMGVLYLVGAARAFSDRDRDAPLAALAFSCASLAAFVLFVLRDSPWVAGKGLVYLYPCTLALALYAGLGRDTSTAAISRPILRQLALAGKIVAMSFVAWQLAFAGLRPVYAAADRDYPRYVRNHGRYRAIDCDIAPIRAVLGHGEAVAVCSVDPWKWAFLGLSLAEGHTVRLPAQMAAGPSGDIIPVALDRPPSGAPAALTPYVAAQNASFVLYRMPRGVLADIAPHLTCQTKLY
jgi:hypothetical protein